MKIGKFNTQMPALRVITYHYVRDLPRTPFPRIKGMLIDNFRWQVTRLKDLYEIVSLEAAIAFLSGQYNPPHDLCLLTFDDGLKDHYNNVMPILDDLNISGVFFITTKCLDEHMVIGAHKNHFLMASLGVETYQDILLSQLKAWDMTVPNVDVNEASTAYPLDREAVAVFKYLLNFILDAEVRDRILDELFEQQFGRETEFAQQLYLSWPEVRKMQSAGAWIGGHSHSHVALASLTPEQQRGEILQCRQILNSRLSSQPLWPFSFPYGSPASYNVTTIELLNEMGFNCAFTTEHGVNMVGESPYRLKRIDTVKVGL